MKIIKPEWRVSNRIHAFTTTREAGESKSPYHFFNLATHVGEDPTVVALNRQRLVQDYKLPAEPLWLNQVHGTTVVQANSHIGNIPPEADAVWTDQVNTVCVVLTADCLPILVGNQDATQVAAIHAGWRGLAAGVIEKTITAMASNSNLYAWLGPAIGPEIFEISDEVRQQFLQHDARASVAFRSVNHQKWLANLYLLATQRLNDCGVYRIYGGDYCTYSDSDRFYSYRRDAGRTGRMASLIWLSI